MAVADPSPYIDQDGTCAMGVFDVTPIVTAANSATECKLICTNQLGCVAADWDT
jgi:hypothetical protein